MTLLTLTVLEHSAVNFYLHIRIMAFLCLLSFYARLLTQAFFKYGSYLKLLKIVFKIPQ